MAPPRTRETRNCVRCNTEFEIHQCILKRGPGRGRFCSPKCANQGSTHPHWNGGKVKRRGYVGIRMPNHPRSVHGYVFEHILVAEKALGHALPPKAVVHHANGDKTDNRPCNLVICENAAYHNLLHERMRDLAKAAA